MIEWEKGLPRWGGDIVEPPEGKKDIGYLVGDKPPASWENWFRKLTYEALLELRQKTDVVTQQSNQIATDVGACSLQKTVAQSIPNNTIVAVDFNSRIIDADEMHSDINPSRITIKKAGVYLIIGAITFPANVVGERSLFLRKVGTNAGVTSSEAYTALPKTLNICRILELGAGEYVELFTKQSSGGALDINSGSVTYFQAIKIRV